MVGPARQAWNLEVLTEVGLEERLLVMVVAQLQVTHLAEDNVALSSAINGGRLGLDDHERLLEVHGLGAVPQDDTVFVQTRGRVDRADRLDAGAELVRRGKRARGQRGLGGN
jgi:hypothetical protein